MDYIKIIGITWLDDTNCIHFICFKVFLEPSHAIAKLMAFGIPTQSRDQFSQCTNVIDLHISRNDPITFNL